MPPSFNGAFQLTFTLSSPVASTATASGMPGSVPGVTCIGVLPTLRPRAFSAYTVTVYVTPFSSPSIRLLLRFRSASRSILVPSSVSSRMIYFVIGLPLVFGSVHVTVTSLLPGIAFTFFGAWGDPSITRTDVLSALSPISFFVVTVTIYGVPSCKVILLLSMVMALSFVSHLPTTALFTRIYTT